MTAIAHDTRRMPNRAPVLFLRCPEHHQLVGADGDGRLLGYCWGCVNTATAAKAKIERRS